MAAPTEATSGHNAVPSAQVAGTPRPSLAPVARRLRRVMYRPRKSSASNGSCFILTSNLGKPRWRYNRNASGPRICTKCATRLAGCYSSRPELMLQISSDVPPLRHPGWATAPRCSPRALIVESGSGGSLVT